MFCFAKFKCLLALKLNFNGSQFYKEISIFGNFNKLEKKLKLYVVEKKLYICDKIIKFEVNHFEHLRSNTRVNYKEEDGVLNTGTILQKKCNNAWNKIILIYSLMFQHINLL